jgi:hypothetical protein
VAFFGGLDTLNQVEDPLHANRSRVHVASRLDLADMKMRVIQVRGSWKDYKGIHTLVARVSACPQRLRRRFCVLDLDPV